MCYSAVADAAIAEKIEQLGLDFRKIYDQTCESAINKTGGRANGVAILM